MGFKVFGKNPSGKRLERVEQSPNFIGSSFQNLESTYIVAKRVSSLKLLRGFFNRNKSVSPPGKIFAIQNNLKDLSSENPTVVWFGHSSYALLSKSFSILIDPVLNANASPFRFLIKSFNGSDIYSVKDLPNIDMVVITHDHYDHLCYSNIMELQQKCKRFIVPLGVGEHLEYWGIDPANIVELDWGQQVEVNTEVSMIATPARHFSGRTFTRNKTLWCSYVLMMQGKKIYLGGDSGYGVHYKTIGEKYGPFDLAILECGQYGYGWPQIHMIPEETVTATFDLRAKALMPVHWGRFAISQHSWNESVKRAYAAANDLKLRIVAPRIGEFFEIGLPFKQSEWWNSE